MNTHYNIYTRARQHALRLLLFAVAAVFTSSMQAQEPVNELSIPDFEGRINKTVSVPIYLNNTQEVVAAQFDIELPFNVPADGVATLTNRANQHSVTVNAKGGRKFTVVIMSMQNNGLRGNSGLLLRIPMQTYDDGNTATPYAVNLSNIVLSDRQGNNIVTGGGKATGHFVVSRADLPDLIVSSVTPTVTEVQPGGTFNCIYTVKNDGTGNTRAGWSEKVYLESALTGVRTFVGNAYHSDSLKAGAEVTRKFTTYLPTLPHADGQQYVYVEVTPDPLAGELLVDQGNNSRRSEQTVSVGKQLFASVNKQNVTEGYTYYSYYYSSRDYITLTVSRSGDWSTEEQFPLTCSVSGLLSMNNAILSPATPQWIVIPAKAAGTTVRIYAVDDQIVRAREADLIIGESNGYNAQTIHVTRTDNDTDPLSLKASLQQMTEGKDKQLVLTATRGGEMAEALELNINCSQAARFTPVPIKMTIEKGKASATATLTLIDDDTPQPDMTARFSTWATDYQSASTSVSINDDDRPALTLTLSPAIVCENAGSQAATAIVRRDRGDDKDGMLSVRLSSASESNVYFADKVVEFRKGETEKEVKVGVTDNSAVDGQRQYSLSAALYLPSANTHAAGSDRAFATTQLTVTDDESPYLTVTSRSSLVAEGSSFTATLTRYVATANNAVTVNLRADNAADVVIPSTVTIPAGSRSVNFTVQVNRNEQQDDERMLFINASASGLASGQLGVRITDRTLPDVACSAPGYDGTQLYSGMEATFSPEILNVGTAELPAGVQIDFFLAPSDQLYSYTRTTPLFSVHTNAPLGIAESKTFQFTGTMPAVVGTYWLYARVNSDNKVNEYSTANNVSTSPAKMTIAAPFSVAELKVERESYLPGEAVKVSGRVTTKQANGLKNQYVSVTLSGNGQSSKSATALVDEQTGDFTVYPVLSSSASGIVNVKARALGQTEADKTAQLNVWSMALTADKTTWTVDENYPQDGVITLRNHSGKTVTGLAISNSALPFGCELNTLQLSKTTLEPGAFTTLSYHVNGTKSMTSGQYAPITITVTSAEGAVAELPVRYYCRATDSKLSFTASDLKQTLLLDSERSIAVKVTNHGLKASGDISLIVPSDLDWLECQTASPMASIAPGGGYAYIYFKLKHKPGMHSGETFKANVSLNPATGQAIGGQLEVKIVGTEYSKLDVNVEDIFVKARREYKHVSAAQVTVTETRTGRQVMTGLTDGTGHWMTDRITQGTYNVTVSALRHKTIRQTLVIGPGDEQHMSFFLPYQAVVTDFVTNQANDGTYTMTSTIDIDRTAPQAIVVPTLPENGFECGTQDFDLVLTNLGSFTAENVSLVFPPMANAKFTVGTIGSIAPGGEVVVPVHYEGPEQGRRRAIATILMYYGFSIGGSYYSESDYYQSLVGCLTSEQPQPPVVEPGQPTLPDDDTPDSSDDGSRNEAEPEGPSASTALPTMNSSVTLQFDDISRVNIGEPFYATLHIINGQDAALRNIVFSHTVSDESDDYETDMTVLFGCEQTEAEGFGSQSGQFTLAGRSEGFLRLMFTPTNHVTADGKHLYYIGGRLNYTDAAQNFGQSVMLPQIALTVSQKGEASIVYLLQSDFLGNDTTAEQHMTAVPAQHVMLVRNEGQTDISSLQISSDEPTVVTNKSGEAATLKMLHASIDRQRTNEQLLSLRSDTLKAGALAIGRWVMQSQSDSHLAQSDSLAQSVVAKADGELKYTVTGIHKLYRAVKNMYETDGTQADDEATDQEVLLSDLSQAEVFLLDDEEDEDRLPDNVLFGNGEETALHVIGSENVSVGGAGGTFTLTVNSEEAGWIYLRVGDLTNGFMNLHEAKRGNTVMSRANVWVTDHTVLNDYTSVSEYALHLADSVPAGQTTYTIVYAERPGEAVHPMNCRLYTASGAEVHAGETTTERVVKAVVEFTRNIQYLYVNRVPVFAGGQQQSTELIDIEPASGPANVWTINMSRLEPIPGLHSIFIDGASFKEPKPNNKRYGEGTLNIEWTEDITAQLPVVIEVATGDSTGSVSHKSGDYAYGVLTLKAAAAEGYQFDHWEADGQRIEEAGEELAYDVQRAVTLRAYFTKRLYEVNIVYDEEQGIVSGAAAGFYEYRKPLRLTAIANDGYEFVQWKWNADSVTSQQIDVVVTADCTYTAMFRKVETAISDLRMEHAPSTAIFSLSGQLLRRGVTNISEELRSLPEGLYIIGGRKVMNRRR